MRFALEASGAKLIGEDVGCGPAFVLLHAGAERRRVWDPIVERLVAAGHRCVTLDLRGHGESGGSRDADFSSFIEDADRLRRYVAQPAIYVGSSLGGLCLLGMIGASPSDQASIAGLVLVDVIPDPNHERVRAGLSAALGPAVADSPLVLDILSRAEELRAAARSLATPTLLVRAVRSFGMSDQDTARFRGLVPHANVVAVASGHLIAREQPNALCEHLLAFAEHAEVKARAAVARKPDAHARAEAWLASRGASDIPHLAGTLLEHLRRTALWLDRWDAPEHVKLAGLCHAAYGTDGFDTSLTEHRDELTEVIGAPAEAVVRSYCACDRKHLYAQLGNSSLTLRDRFTQQTRELSSDELDDFAVLTLANELDVALHAAPESKLRGAIARLFEALAAHRPKEAALALRALR